MGRHLLDSHGDDVENVDMESVLPLLGLRVATGADLKNVDLKHACLALGLAADADSKIVDMENAASLRALRAVSCVDVTNFDSHGVDLGTVYVKGVPTLLGLRAAAGVDLKNTIPALHWDAGVADVDRRIGCSEYLNLARGWRPMS